ncbi:DUF58 domain-containing protein [Arthrobacter sp. JSM 101049]|uniref:DUF58 domain-containing protein n=1 Tax=Arthrobacter sp. JSM 101049 TaxID=929097 RepID=UPI00356786E1
METGRGPGNDGGSLLPLRARLKPAFLTPRGWALLVCGAGALLLAWFLGRRELVNIAVFLLAAPLLAAAAVSLGRTRVHVRRTFEPDPVAAGSSTVVTLAVHHPRPLPAGTVLDEQLPADFGSTPSFTVDGDAEAAADGRTANGRTANGTTAIHRYRLRPTHRGVYAVGPLRARLGDPFGLAVRPLSVDRPSPLTVVPPITHLPPTGVLGSIGAQGTATSHHQATPENDDVMTREYRDGDSMRRVHWPATARHQTLMVRQEEFQRTPQTTFVVDTRLGPYEGSYVGSDAQTAIPNFLAAPGTTTACFDWTIRAAIGIGAHLASLGHELDVLDETGAPLAGPSDAPRSGGSRGPGRFAGPDAAVDLQLVLAPVGLKPAGAPADPTLFAAGAGSHPLLLFTGALTAEQAGAWVQAIGTHRHVVALVVASRPAGARTATRTFRAAGWTALPTDPATGLVEAWLGLAAGERRAGPQVRP